MREEPMKKLFLLLLLLSCLSLFGQVTDSTGIAPGRLVIQVSQSFQTITTRSDGCIETEQSWFNALASEYNITLLKKLFVGSSKTELQNKYLMCFPDSLPVDSVATAFESKANVMNTWKDCLATLCTNDNYYSYQWYLQRVQASSSYYTTVNAIAAPATPVIIAEIDTGIDYTHPDLSDNMLKDVNGQAIGYNNTTPIVNAFSDDCGHGTLVAGAIAAVSNNANGIASLASNGCVKLMPIKTFRRDRKGYISDICDGINWAIEHGAKIVNCSFTTSNIQNTTGTMIEDLTQLVNSNPQVAFIAAAGNVSSFTNYPASISNVFAVAGTDYNNQRSFSSNAQNWVDIAAPAGSAVMGVTSWTAHNAILGFISTIPDYNPQDPYQMHYTVEDPAYTSFDIGNWVPSSQTEEMYDYYLGTSFSTGMVSGLMGMLWAKYYTQMQNGTMSVNDLKSIIQYSSQDFNSNEYDFLYEQHMCGAGIINAREAVMSPHPNIQLRQFQIGASTYKYPQQSVDTIGSVQWGSSTTLRLSLVNKWVAGSGVTISLSSTDPYIRFGYPGVPPSTYYNYGNIAGYTTSITDDITITDESSEVRTNVPITILVSANGMPRRIFTIYIDVIRNTQAVVSNLLFNTGETTSTELVVDDLEHDDIEEMIVGTSMGRLFVYRNGGWSAWTMPGGCGITATPAIGDVNGDGVKEIVTGNFNGDICVWNTSGGIISFRTGFGNGKIANSIVIEDVTDDGNLDIICTTQKRELTDPYQTGVFVLDYVNNQTYPILGNNYLSEPIAIGEIDNDSVKEIVVASTNVYNGTAIINVPPSFSIYKWSNDTGRIEQIVRNHKYYINDMIDAYSIDTPVIGDFDSDGITDILLPEAVRVGTQEVSENNYYHYKEDSWVFGNLNVSFVGRQLSNSVFNLLGNEGIWHAITIKNGVNSTYMEVFDNPNTTNPSASWQLPSDAFMTLIADITDKCNNYPSGRDMLSQEIIVIGSNSIRVIMTGNRNGGRLLALYEDSEYALDFQGMDFTSAALQSYEGQKYLWVITHDGRALKFRFEPNNDRVDDYKQVSQTARHTNRFEQQLPRTTTDRVEIFHPFVVRNSVEISNTSLSIYPGVEGRVESGGSLHFTRTASLYIYGEQMRKVTLKSISGSSNLEYWKGITLNNLSSSDISWLDIEGALTGITYSNTGDHNIQNSQLLHNQVGVQCYNSIALFYNNKISDNTTGISANNYAAPVLSTNAMTRNGINDVINNDIGIFSDISSPDLYNGHNNLEYNDSNITFAGILSMTKLSAVNNWWGSDDSLAIASTISDPTAIDFTPYDLTPNDNSWRGQTQMSVFQQGVADYMSKKYQSAVTGFSSVLADSIYTNEDIESVYFLFNCYNKLNNVQAYSNIVATKLQETQPIALHKAFENVNALIDRHEGRYSAAIAYYESVLTNNPSYADSCYAVIDLGDTYLESNGRATGNLTQYCPESYKKQQSVKIALLTSIRTNEKVTGTNEIPSTLVLQGNFPNPFNPVTTIKFALPSKGHTKVTIYNIKGQQVKKLCDGNLEKGSNSIVWDGRDNKGSSVASGLYLYRIEFAGKVYAKKMMMLK